MFFGIFYLTRIYNNLMGNKQQNTTATKYKCETIRETENWRIVSNFLEKKIRKK